MTDEICRYKHGVLRCANFDGFQIAAGSFSSVSPFLFCCFVFDINQLKVKFVDHYAITKTDSNIY